MRDIDLREAVNWILLDSPEIFVHLAGLFWAVLTWSKHPRVSLLAADF